MQFRCDLIRAVFAGDRDQLGAVRQRLQRAEIIGLQVAIFPSLVARLYKPLDAAADLLGLVEGQIAHQALDDNAVKGLSGQLRILGGPERYEMGQDAFAEGIGGLIRIEHSDPEHGYPGHGFGNLAA